MNQEECKYVENWFNLYCSTTKTPASEENKQLFYAGVLAMLCVVEKILEDPTHPMMPLIGRVIRSELEEWKEEERLKGMLQ